MLYVIFPISAKLNSIACDWVALVVNKEKPVLGSDLHGSFE